MQRSAAGARAASVSRREQPAHAQPTSVLTDTYTEEEYWDDLLRVTGGQTDELPANAALQESIVWLLKRPAGRPPHEVRRSHASFSYQAGSWSKPRRVVAKVEWHPDELNPRVGFIVTKMTRPAERVAAFYSHRGTAEQLIKEDKNAVTRTRLSCTRIAANAVRLQLHALAYNLANFLRTPALPAEVAQWSMTTLRERLVRIGTKIVRHGRSITFQMAEVMVPRDLFQTILAAIAALRPLPQVRCASPLVQPVAGRRHVSP